jgi:Dyp-type peroxidase family
VAGTPVRSAKERIDLTDVQGLVVRGYGALPFGSYLLFQLGEPADAAEALRRWAASATTAADRGASTALNVAFTAPGLVALLPQHQVPGGFSEPFTSGMVEEHRSRLLGDVDGDDPRGWAWGGPATPPVHVLLLVYARDPDTLARQVATAREDARAGHLSLVAQLDTAPLSTREAFGFHDGISQPLIGGLPHAAAGGDVVAAGEFVLGYTNEYGRRTERPLLPPSEDPDHLLPRDADGSGAADLGRNGSYLVFRQLEQDVEGFWRFLTESSTSGGELDVERRDLLAAKIVGRWPGGAPLVLAPGGDDPSLADANGFAYHHEDPLGLACPVGAHVRRVNPRDSLEPGPGTDRSTRINHRHRLVRRGRNYVLDDPNGQTTRGLHFHCLCGNLARQFEFVQHTWLENPTFNGMYDSPDPLVSTKHQGPAFFVEPALPVRRRRAGLPQFVHVKGGAYFFLPGISALRYLASQAAPPG